MLENTFGKRGLFWLMFGLVGSGLVGTSLLVILFVGGVTLDDDEASEAVDETSLYYVDFNNNPDQYVSARAYVTMGAYQQNVSETINVQVLEGVDASEISGYMLNYFVAGLGVGCTYCHNIENYAADEWDDPEAMANKAMARNHLRMTQDLNRQWLPQLATLIDTKQPSGSQIICATCHNGVAKPVIWQDSIDLLPDDFRIELGSDIVYSVEEEGYYNVNARTDISLDRVQENQNLMYHMNTSLNVGCTHCHNSRYFPSYEVPAKYYSINMLQMSQYIQQVWGENGENVLGGQQVSCNMCHNGAAIPGGSAISTDVLPAALVPVSADE